MSDYIKREDARELIARLHGGCITDDVKTFIDYTLLGVPSADVVEVVHCRDCKHYIKSKRYGMMCEILVHAEQGDDFYCSYGERKEQEHE